MTPISSRLKKTAGMQSGSVTPYPGGAPMPKRTTLTTKQQRFVDFYDGNATEAARLAGYSAKNHDGLKKAAFLTIHQPLVAAAIQEREKVKSSRLIANREARQKMWTAMMNDPKVSHVNRLKASELLGRSAGDFIERVALADEKTFKALNVLLTAAEPTPENALVKDASLIANAVKIENGSMSGNGNGSGNGRTH
jgi:hypothetical protein